MSGGNSGIDPYHQADPPKRKFIQNEIEFTPKLVDGKIVVISGKIGAIVQQQKGKEKVYWYKCEGCGQLFPSESRRYGKTISCSLDCKHKVQSRSMIGRKHSPESLELMSRVQQETWNNPIIAKRRRDAAKTRKKPEQVRRKKQPKKIYEYTCAHCGERFKTERKRELDNKYYSQKCVGMSQRKGKYVKCDNPGCFNEVWRRPSILDGNRNYCSAECANSDPYMRQIRSQTHMGELNPNWKGGVGRSVAWEKIREQIRKRDDHTCQACGKIHAEGSAFPVHHIRPESTGGPDEPWNLVTLCPPCHYYSDAQDGDFKIPHTLSGIPIRDVDDLKRKWERYQKESKDKSRGRNDVYQGTLVS